MGHRDSGISQASKAPTELEILSGGLPHYGVVQNERGD